MADCVVALITADLIAALHQKNIEISGVQKENYAEAQRSVYDSQGKEVYTDVAGPWPEKMDSDGREEHDALYYVVECHISGINDAPPADPITLQTKNTGADIVKLIMADTTRGGNALLTKPDGLPYYCFAGSVDAPEYIIRIDVIVEVFTDIFDPYFQK
jgi:hypothetical protein